jgi:HlyD family secretion protein
MTANVTIKAAEARNVLRLPNAALRYKPKLDTSLRGKLSELRTSEQEGGGKAPKAEGTEEGQGPHGSGAPSEAKGPHEGGQASPEMKGAPEGGASPEMKEAFRKMRGMKGKKNGNFQVVWVPDGKALKPVDVKLGLTDGTSSEILEGDLKEGSIVAVPTGTKEAFRMPFSPFGGGRR